MFLEQTQMRQFCYVTSILLIVFCPSLELQSADLITLQQSCETCHGVNGQGDQTRSTPALAGLDAAYIIRQLNHFQSSKRGNKPQDSYGQQMRAISSTLTAEQIEQVAKHFAGLKAKSFAFTQGQPNLGEKIYQSNCAACHGHKAQGNPNLKAPALFLQPPEYLIRQLIAFRHDIRGTDKQDVQGRQMAMMAKLIKDEPAIHDVVSYIIQLADQPAESQP